MSILDDIIALLGLCLFLEHEFHQVIVIDRFLRETLLAAAFLVYYVDLLALILEQLLDVVLSLHLAVEDVLFGRRYFPGRLTSPSLFLLRGFMVILLQLSELV